MQGVAAGPGVDVWADYLASKHEALEDSLEVVKGSLIAIVPIYGLLHEKGREK